MTNENDYLELAEDCKNRVEEKNKQIQHLSIKKDLYLKIIRETNHIHKSLNTCLDIYNDLTKHTRSGPENIIINKIIGHLIDLDMIYASARTISHNEDDEMDELTLFTINELT
jgi:hypothetical protein